MTKPVLPTLAILCVKEPSPVQMEAMARLKNSNEHRDFHFYWMNRFVLVFVYVCLAFATHCVSSSLYQQVVRHLLQGELHPAIIVVNYTQVYNGDYVLIITRLFVSIGNLSACVSEVCVQQRVEYNFQY